MDYQSGLSRLTVLVIVLTTLVSGPIVGAIDFTSESEDGDPILSSETKDKATVEVISNPDGEVALEKGDFGNDVFFLKVPRMSVKPIMVQGNPRITYKIRLPKLRYSRVTSNILGANQRGQVFVLKIQEDTIQKDRISESEYTGELSVTIHDSNGATVVYQTNRTVLVKK